MNAVSNIVGPIGGTSPRNRELVACIEKSKLFLDYRSAFETVTGLPLAIRVAGAFESSFAGSKQNRFCALIAARLCYEPVMLSLEKVWELTDDFLSRDNANTRQTYAKQLEDYRAFAKAPTLADALFSLLKGGATAPEKQVERYKRSVAGIRDRKGRLMRGRGFELCGGQFAAHCFAIGG